MSDAPPAKARILVIKLGALGDFIQALGPFAAIRQHHRGAYVALLTTPGFAELGRATRLFDAVEDQGRPPWWRIDLLAHLFGWLNNQQFDRVYDLQTSRRSSFLYHLFVANRRPEWSGIVAGCSHPHDNPARDTMHTVDRQRDQLRRAGIEHVPAADLSFLDADVSRFDLPPRFALLAPGGSAKRPGKRWPARHYAGLAKLLIQRGVTPVAVGGKEERALGEQVVEAAGGRNLAGETSLAELASIARRATVAVGNDTGPMHLIAGAGAPSLVLFSSVSDPDLCAPVGREVRVLRRERLEFLEPGVVAASLPMR